MAIQYFWPGVTVTPAGAAKLWRVRLKAYDTILFHTNEVGLTWPSAGPVGCVVCRISTLPTEMKVLIRNNR